MLAAAVVGGRAEIAAAYATLQATGGLGGHDAAAVASALAAVWAAGDAVLQEEARAFVGEAAARGLVGFADVLPPTPPPRSRALLLIPHLPQIDFAIHHKPHRQR